MGSKGAHTLIEALIQLQQQGLSVQASLAGDSFQSGYREQLEQWLKQHNLDGAVQFVGQLGRQALARFYALHHVGVFPSIHPEAFGIVAAEMMASGLVVVSSGVGGAGELIEDGRTGLLFNAGDSQDLARCLMRLISDSTLLIKLRQAGRCKLDNTSVLWHQQKHWRLASNLLMLQTTKKQYFRNQYRSSILSEHCGMHHTAQARLDELATSNYLVITHTPSENQAWKPKTVNSG